MVERDRGRFVPEALCQFWTHGPCDEPDSLVCLEVSEVDLVCREGTCTNQTGCLAGSPVTVVVSADRRILLNPRDLPAMQHFLETKLTSRSSAGEA